MSLIPRRGFLSGAYQPSDCSLRCINHPFNQPSCSRQPRSYTRTALHNAAKVRRTLFITTSTCRFGNVLHHVLIACPRGISTRWTSSIDSSDWRTRASCLVSGQLCLTNYHGHGDGNIAPDFSATS